MPSGCFQRTVISSLSNFYKISKGNSSRSTSQNKREWDSSKRGQPLEPKRSYRRPEPLKAFSKSFSYVVGNSSREEADDAKPNSSGPPRRAAAATIHHKQKNKEKKSYQKKSTSGKEKVEEQKQDFVPEEKLLQVEQPSPPSSSSAVVAAHVLHPESFTADSKQEQRHLTNLKVIYAVTQNKYVPASILKKAGDFVIGQKTPQSYNSSKPPTTEQQQRRSVKIDTQPLIFKDNSTRDRKTSKSSSFDGGIIINNKNNNINPKNSTAPVSANINASNNDQSVVSETESRLKTSTRCKKFNVFWKSKICFVDGKFVRLREGETPEMYQKPSHENEVDEDRELLSIHQKRIARRTIQREKNKRRSVAIKEQDFAYSFNIDELLLEETFVRFDSDRDGFLDVHELVSVMA